MHPAPQRANVTSAGVVDLSGREVIDLTGDEQPSLQPPHDPSAFNQASLPSQASAVGPWSDLAFLNPPSTFHRSARAFNLPDPDLGGEIHPLFQPSNIDLLTTVNGQQVQHAYPHLAFQLATRLLEAALPFFAALFFGVRNWREGMLHLPAIPPTLTDEQKQKIREKLAELVRHVKLEIEHTTTHGQCRPHLEDYMNGQTATIDSTIILKAKYFDEIEAAQRRGDLVSVLIHSLQLAESVNHEVSHAALFAAHPLSHGLAFIGNSLHNEIGFSLQKYLFNGMLNKVVGDPVPGVPLYSFNGTPSSLDFMLILADLPHYSTMTDYYVPNNWCHLRAGVALLPVNVAWHVSILWVARLFREDFWRGVNRAKDLHPFKMTGRVRFLNDGAEREDTREVVRVRLLETGRILSENDEIAYE